VFLVQKKDLSKGDLDAAWTVQALISLLQTICVAGLSIPISILYGEGRLVAICGALAAAIFISGFKNIGIVYFHREMRFHLEFVLVSITKLCAFVVTMTLAVVLGDYWALVIGIVTSRLAEFLLSYILHAYRPRIRLSGWRDLIGFSKWVYVNNLLTVLGQRSPEFLIGRMCGPVQLGLFSVGFDIAMLPSTEMVAPINRAVYPGYARMIRDKEQLEDGYLSVIGLIALIGLPAAVGIASTVDVLIPLLLGVKWLDAIPIVQILAIAGGVSALSTNAGAVYVSQGKPWVVTCLSGVQVIILVPSVVFLIQRFGPIGGAMALLMTSLIMCALWFTAIIRSLRCRLLRVLMEIYRPLVGVGTMFLAVRYVMSVVVQGSSPHREMWEAAILVLAGMLVYIASVTLLWLVAGRPGGAEESLFSFLQEKVVNGRVKTEGMFRERGRKRHELPRIGV
jgi:lipopolysaccharide exporter